MKRIHSTTPVVSVLMVMSLAAAIQPVSAGVEAECSQEAEDFGVVPELRDDYISGCIDSRGGESTSAIADENHVPPSESDDMINPEAGSENTPE